MNFSRFLNYAQWADARTLEMLKANPKVESKAWALFSHMLAAEHLWLCRLQGRNPDTALWPELGYEECLHLLEMNFLGYSDYLKNNSENLSTTIKYQTTKGEHFETSAMDILYQVMTHGAYHRGQISEAIRRSGGQITNTDFIAFLRESH